MTDRGQIGGILFIVLLGLAVVVGLLGISVLIRLKRAGRVGSSVETAGAGVLLLILAFFSTSLPYVALVPAIGFLACGFMAFNKETLNRDSGIILLLTGIAWSVFAALQANLLASADDIRIDLILTLPILVLTGSIGWRIFALLR